MPRLKLWIPHGPHHASGLNTASSHFTRERSRRGLNLGEASFRSLDAARRQVFELYRKNMRAK